MEDDINLNTLIDVINYTEVENLKCYLITRALKDGIKKNSKNKDKYLFKVFQINLDTALRDLLYASTKSELERVNKRGWEITDYSVISDDTGHLFTYDIAGKTFSFQDVVANQLGREVPHITKWEDIDSEGIELWAYCLGFENTTNHEWIYTFRKSSNNKIATAEKKKGLWALFDTRNLSLSLFNGSAINLDSQIDCVLYQNVFYVIRKFNFETLLGLQEEYEQKAIEIADKIASNPVFEGGNKLQELVKTKPSIHKKLIKLEKLGSLIGIDKKVNKMKKIGRKYGSEIVVKQGKIVLDSEESIDHTIKLMCDYYKKGEVSGNAYGTFSGIVINEK